MKTPNIKEESVLEKNPEILASDLDGETVMMSIQNGRYYGMDTIGTAIWKLLDEKTTFSVLIDTLLEEYDVSREECTRDVLDFLEELRKNNLVLIT